MINLLPHILLISLITVGAHLAAMELIATFYVDPDEFYSWQTKMGKSVLKPLIYCPTCMASVWGTSLHFILGGDVFSWIPTILAVAFTNTLLNKWASSN